MSKVPRLALVLSLPLIIPAAPIKPVATVKPVSRPAIETQTRIAPKPQVRPPQASPVKIQTPTTGVAAGAATSKSSGTVVTKAKSVPIRQQPKHERTMHTAAQVKPTKPATPFQQQPASSTVSATADSFSSAESTATPTTAPMIEGSQNEETASQLATKWEQRLFGYAHTNDSMDKRLSRIERNVYGAVKQGTDQARVDMLKAALDIKDEPISSLSTETPIVSQTRTTTDSDDCSCEKGNAYYAKGDYKNAAFYYHKAAVNMAKEWGTNNANVANMKHSEGLCYYNMSQYQHADALLNESLQIYKRSAASHKTDLALVYWTLANSATETRSWDKAVSAYTSAISYYKILKPSKNYADCLAAFASCYQRRGWIQKSHELRAQSQEVLRRAVIEKGPSEKDTIDIS